MSSGEHCRQRNAACSVRGCVTKRFTRQEHQGKPWLGASHLRNLLEKSLWFKYGNGPDMHESRARRAHSFNL